MYNMHPANFSHQLSNTVIEGVEGRVAIRFASSRRWPWQKPDQQPYMDYKLNRINNATTCHSVTNNKSIIYILYLITL